MSELFENLLTSSPFAVIELFQLELDDGYSRQQ